MEKLVDLTGFSSKDKSVNILHAQYELDKKKKIYRSVNLNSLPDKGAKLKKQIDELEDLLQTLTLNPTNGNETTSTTESSNNDGSIPDLNKSSVAQCEKYAVDAEKLQSTSCDKENCNISSSLHKSKHNNASDSVIKTESCKNIEQEPFCKISEPNKFLSFSDLTPKQMMKNIKDDVMNSPSFKTWRQPGVIRKTLLTEPKPLIEKSSAKSNLNHNSLNPVLQPSEESIKNIHSSLVTYPDNYEEESDPESLKSTLMLHQRKGLAWMMWREEQDPKGGILADDMGLGKTLSVISLILKQKERNDFCALKDHDFECRSTLIVCSASLVHQWNDEIIKHCEIDALKVLLYHGPKRNKDHKKMKSYDVVITTYNLVQTEKKKLDNEAATSPLFCLKFERIVLDEAHTIKTHTSQTAQAIFSLKSFRKWAVTGTPIHNAFKDVYALVKFLQFSPFDDFKKFKKLTDDSTDLSEERRNLLIKSILLRRTKDEVDEWGKPLIEMKNKSFSVHYIELTDDERKVYNTVNEKIKNKFSQYLMKTSKFRSGSSLLTLLLRLQQCCNHVSLLKEELELPNDVSDVTDALSSLKLDEASSDSSDSGLDLTFTNLDYENVEDVATKSSKIKALFNELHKVFESSENKDKSVIVSQWVSLLDIIAFHLKEEGIDYHLIAGCTKVEDRQKYMDDFNNNEKGPKVMLLSLRAGGVGLNLIGANNLFLLDLHWNPALEMQACDRIHRVGQKKDVVIHKFICKNTIEEKINDLQKSKCRIASNALKGTKHNTEKLTIEDYKMLFGIIK